MKRRIISLFAALALLMCMNLTAFAHEVPDLTRTDCSIALTLKSGSDKIEGAELVIYQVGDIQENDGNYNFVLSAAFAGSGLSLSNVQSSELAEGLAKYAGEKKCTALQAVKTDKDGYAIFKDLKPGLYLVVQEKPADGYTTIKPFVISTPNFENGTYVYTVEASPKVGEPAPEPTEKPTEPPKPSEPTLPQTGQLNWPVPILAVAGLSLFVVGWAMCFGRKKESYEE